MEYFIYPLKKMYLSQDYTQGNHLPHWKNANSYYDYPIDDCCGDVGRDPIYATSAMRVIKIYGLNNNTTNTVVLETVDEVKTVNCGVIRVCLTITHLLEDELKGMYVGKVFQKGDIICHEGDDGYATGNHLHLTVCKGYKGMYKNNNGKWCFIGDEQFKPEDIFYVDPSFTKVLNAQTIKWQMIPNYVGEAVDRSLDHYQIEVLISNLNGRFMPNGLVLGYVNMGFYNILDEVEDGYMWYKIGDNLWIAYDDEWEKLWPKKKSLISKLFNWLISLFKR